MEAISLTEAMQEHLLRLMRPEKEVRDSTAVPCAILRYMESLDAALHAPTLAFVFEHRFVAKWAPVQPMPHFTYSPSVEVRLTREAHREVDALCQEAAVAREAQGLTAIDAAEHVLAVLRRHSDDLTHRIGVLVLVLDAFAFDFSAIAMRPEDIEHDDVEGDERVRTMWKHRRVYAQLRGLLVSRHPTNMSGFGWKMFEIVRTIEDPRERGTVLGSFCKYIMERKAR
ncbi:MAG: hypothetical protein Q7R80_03450 [bacterium]|nr:hypothetical protein [bacterium]